MKIAKHILFLLIQTSLLSCVPTFKDSYSSSGEGRKLKLKFKDRYASSSNNRLRNALKFKDSYGGSSGRRNQLGFKDSFGGGNVGRRNQIGFRDSFGSGPIGRKSPNYGAKRSYNSGGGRRNQLGFKDSYGGGYKPKIKFRKKDSYSVKQRSQRRGYKDPNKKWWMIGGKKARQGRSKYSPDSYGAKPKKKKIPKKKKKIKRTTKFEGQK